MEKSTCKRCGGSIDDADCICLMLAPFVAGSRRFAASVRKLEEQGDLPRFRAAFAFVTLGPLQRHPPLGDPPNLTADMLGEALFAARLMVSTLERMRAWRDIYPDLRRSQLRIVPNEDETK